MLMVIEPALAKVRDGDRLEAEHGDVAGFQLRVGLRRKRAGGFQIGADARPAAPAILVVAQIPGPAPLITLNFSDAKR